MRFVYMASIFSSSEDSDAVACCASHSMEYFSIVKFTIENRYFSKIASFATLPFLNIPGFFSKTSDFVVGRVLEFRLRLNIQRDIFYKKFLSLVEITNVILKNRQCCKRRNFRKIAIFNPKFNNEKVS